MKKLWSLMLATILLITCSGCFWGVEHDRDGRGDGKRDGYGHDGGRDRDDHRDRDDRR
jgi:hypothetical protein